MNSGRDDVGMRLTRMLLEIGTRRNDRVPRCRPPATYPCLMARNTDYVITMTTPGGRTFRFRKKGQAWVQRTPPGRTYDMTAEQLLSDLLPPLAGEKPGLTVRVKRRASPRRVGRQSSR